MFGRHPKTFGPHKIAKMVPKLSSDLNCACCYLQAVYAGECIEHSFTGHVQDNDQLLDGRKVVA